MDREADQMKIKQLLTATIASLCSNSLSYSGELTIQGLLGITIDHKDILLVNINETIGHARSTDVAQNCQTGVHTQAEHSPTGTIQPTGIQQNYVSDNSIVAVRQKRVQSAGKSTASKNRGQHRHAAVVNYAQAYPSLAQDIKPEPSLQQSAAQQVKLEPSADYAGGYYASDEDNSYENYDMFYDQSAGTMYTESGGSFSNTNHYADDATQVMEYSKLRAHKIQKMRSVPIKKPAAASRSANRATSQSQSGSKDINSSLIQRALDLVHEGQLTAGVAIKLFGIPRSTFYKKLSMCDQQSQPVSTADTQPEPYYQTGGDFQAEYGSFSEDIADSFVGAGDDADAGISAGQWNNYVDYYTS